MPLSKVIPKGRPEHASLDFDLLRAEGIRHLENFATELWTDYNAHDPGITLLEVLCYAITDLGYRSRMLPVKDLMAAGPKAEEYPWFLASEVLPSSPVTALDYRKLLIDVEGVKNAWMLKGEGEQALVGRGVVFPELLTGELEKDRENIQAFIEKHWQEIPDLKLETDTNGNPILGEEVVVQISDGANTILTVNADGKIFDGQGYYYREDDDGNIIDKYGDTVIHKNDVQKTIFPSLVIDVLDSIEQQLLAIESFPDIRPFVFAIGQSKSDLDNLAKDEIKKTLRSEGHEIEQDEIDDIYQFMELLPESSWPFQTGVDTDRIKSEIPLKVTSGTGVEELEDLQDFLTDAVDLFFEGNEFNEINDEIIAKVRNHLLNPANELDADAQELFDDNNFFKGVNLSNYTFFNSFFDEEFEEYQNNGVFVEDKNAYDHYKTRQLRILQDRYKDAFTESGNLAVFPTIYAIYHLASIYQEEDIAFWKRLLDYKGYFTDLEVKYYLSNNNNVWKVAQIAIEKFLKNAFPKELKDKDEGEVDDIINRLLNYYGLDISKGGEKNNEDRIVEYLFGEKFCEYGRWLIEYGEDAKQQLHLTGLHTILLDLDEDIDTGIPNQVAPVLERVDDTLHANRALCEDFVGLKIVEQRPVGVCLHLEVDPEADEVEVFAEAIRRMQEYLSPVPRFRTFKQRLEELKARGENYSAEQVYQGPLLVHGFLEGEELGSNAPRAEYYHSDLLREVMSVEGVIGLPVLKINPGPEEEGTGFKEATKYNIYTDDTGAYPNPKETSGASYCKPVIDLQQSYLRVIKGVRSFEMNAQQVQGQLELLRLINSPDPMQLVGGPEWEEGTHRPDLSAYRSMQYDLPATYMVGDNRPPNDATPKRKAQHKHLQAYLSFFDQILASYLAQLGRVRALLSVDQRADDPTRILPLLYEQPGFRELIGAGTPFPADTDDWSNIILSISKDRYSVPAEDGSEEPKSDREWVGILVDELRHKPSFSGLWELREDLKSAFSDAPVLFSLYAGQIEDYFWEKFKIDRQSSYVEQFAPVKAQAEDWDNLAESIANDQYSISPEQGNTAQKSDRELVLELTKSLRDKTSYAGFRELRQSVRTAFSETPGLIMLYGRLIEDYFWEKFKEENENPYAELLRSIAESPAEQQNRKNKLLDHLLARFGESFSAFAAALLRPEAEPEDNPRLQSFEEYLKTKAGFLRDVASLAKDRNLGYNYRAFNETENASDVWNTFNVSGLQRRVAGKLGIQNWQARSLIVEPNYRIDMRTGSNRRGMANYRAVLRRRLDEEAEENPEEAVPIVVSPPYNSPRKAQDKINELYKNIWRARYFEEEEPLPDDVEYWFRLKSTAGGKFRAVLLKRAASGPQIEQGGVQVHYELLLRSELLSEDEAKKRIIDELIPLLRPESPTEDNEGFHIVEHILLRPMEQDDPLLELSLGCVPEEIPKDPYSFWITVVAPAGTTRFSDPDFRAFFEHEFRLETPAHVAVRFCYLSLDDMYQFEEAFAVWMFEKAKCSPPNDCRIDEAAERLIRLLNTLPCDCPCYASVPTANCG